MGSGVLLAALVVLWFVVLVPMVVTRGDAQGGRVEAADAGRTLQRRRAGVPVAAATERVSIDREALIDSGELQVDVHALRRRTLAGLVALAGVRSEEHTSELQSRPFLGCRVLFEKQHSLRTQPLRRVWLP